MSSSLIERGLALLRFFRLFPQSLSNAPSGSASLSFDSTHFQTDSLQYTDANSLKQAQEEEEADSSSVLQDRSYSNLQYLVDCIETYWEETKKSHGRQHIDVSSHVSLAKIASLSAARPQESIEDENSLQCDNDSLVQLLTLCDLVVFLAINSTNKEEVVNAIMSNLNEGDQTNIMIGIQQTQEIFGIQSSGDDEEEATQEAQDETLMTPQKRSESASVTDADADSSSTSSSSSSSSSTSSSTSSDVLSSPAYPLQVVSPAATAATNAALAQVATLEQEKTEFMSTIDSLNRELRDLRKNKADLQAQVEHVKAEHQTALSNSLEELRTELEQTHAQTLKNEQLRLNKEVQRRDHELNEVQEKIKQYIEEVSTAQRERSQAQSQISELKQTISSLKDELQVANAKAEELTSVKAKLERVSQKLEEANEAKSILSQQESEQTALVQKIASLETQLSQVDSMNESMKKLRQELVELQNEKLEMSLTIQHQKEDLTAAKEQASTSKTELKNVNDQLKSLKAENATLQTKLTAAESKKASGLDLSGSALDEWKEKAKKFEMENIQLRGQLASANNSGELLHLREKLEIATKTNESLQEKYVESTKKVRTAENEIERLKEEAMEKEKERMEEKLRELQKQKDDQDKEDAESGEIATLKREKMELEATIETLRTQIPSATATASATSSTTTGSSSTEGIAVGGMSAETTAQVQAIVTRNKKLEVYVKQIQKKYKSQESELNLIKELFDKEVNEHKKVHEAYKVARDFIQKMERERLEQERVQKDDLNNISRERKLIASAFYSLGMEYQNALLAGRAVNRTGNQTPLQRSWLNQQRLNNVSTPQH